MSDKEKSVVQMKHEMFAHKFLEYKFDSVKAYIEVYGEKKNEKTTIQCAWEILNNPEVKEMVYGIAEDVFNNSKKEIKKILERLWEIVDVTTQRKKVKVRRLVTKIVDNEDTGKKEIVKEYEDVEEFASYNPNGANKSLETLGKFHDMFVEKSEVTVKGKGMYEDMSTAELEELLEKTRKTKDS